MAVDDPELLAAVEKYAARDRPGTAHVVISALLLVVQFLLARVALFVVALSAMSTDSCAYQECGDQRWANRAVAVAYVGGMALFAVAAVVVVWRLVTRRRALWFAVSACVLQLAIGVIALIMMGLAGPLTK